MATAMKCSIVSHVPLHHPPPRPPAFTAATAGAGQSSAPHLARGHAPYFAHIWVLSWRSAVIFRIFDIGNKKYLAVNDLTAMCATAASLESAGLTSRGSPAT